MSEYANNPKATFDYQIIETLEAGLVLLGHEVRSVRVGKASIKGAYIKIINEEVFLVGSVISPYQPNNMTTDYDEQRSRKLLLTKNQIIALKQAHFVQKLSVIPLKIYNKNHRIKILIGIAKSKKKYDKRESIRKKDLAREKERELQ